LALWENITVTGWYMSIVSVIVECHPERWHPECQSVRIQTCASSRLNSSD